MITSDTKKIASWDDFEKEVQAAIRFEVVYGLFHTAETALSTWFLHYGSLKGGQALDFLGSERMKELCHEDREFYRSWLKLISAFLTRPYNAAGTLNLPVQEGTWERILMLLQPNELESLHDPYRSGFERFCAKVIEEFSQTLWPRELRYHFYNIILGYGWYDLFLLPEAEEIGLEVLQNAVFPPQEAFTFEGLQEALKPNKSIPWNKKRAEYLCILLVRFGKLTLAPQAESS